MAEDERRKLLSAWRRVADLLIGKGYNPSDVFETMAVVGLEGGGGPNEHREVLKEDPYQELRMPKVRPWP